MALVTAAKHNATEDESREKTESYPPHHDDEKKEGASNEILLTKLQKILESVSSQETDLKHKTQKLEEWCQLHRDTLDIAQQTKQQLIEFEVATEDDSEEQKAAKQEKKSAINENLDKLEQHLKRVSWREKKYRCRECIEGELQNKYDSSVQLIAEYKERETAHRALMLKWQSQKEKKNAKIQELSLRVEGLNKTIENLEFENQGLQESSAIHSIRMSEQERLMSELESKYQRKCDAQRAQEGERTLLEAKLKVSVKEIIKLRGAVKDKDEHKTVLLTKLSQVSNNLRAAHNEMELLNDEYLSKFKSFSRHLNDVHSKLESFSVTIRNFSGNALKSSFDTELAARRKSNQELPAWKENIKVQLQKAMACKPDTQQHTLVFNNDTTNKYIKESETHIAHIKLTGLQLLHEYTSLLMQYNHLYILNNHNQNQNNDKKLFQRKK